MISNLIRLGRWLLVAAVVGLAAGAFMTWRERRAEISATSDEQKLARTLQIIRTSTPADRKVLKVLFYGQSITASGWTPAVVEHWHESYPNTVFVVQNRAIGGFSAEELLRTTEQDLSAFYPDLIVFHVYGNHHAYEKIIQLFRSQTAADVIVQTDHGTSMPDLPCAEGLRLTLHRQGGCKGWLWMRQRVWYDEMAYHKIPEFAARYGLAVEPQRRWWREYLLRTGVAPGSLLVDGLHPNAQGKALMATFFNHYFDGLVADWKGESEGSVVSMAIPMAGQTMGFAGSRLELIALKPLSHWPVVRIDGVAPEQMDGCYAVTRASPMKSVPDWPAIRKITLLHDHTAEDWKATIMQIDARQKDFKFAVSGSRSGPMGMGDAFHRFVSTAGTLSFDWRDWMVGRAFSAVPVPVIAPFDVTWSVRFVCGGAPEAIDLGGGAMQYRYVLAAGLKNESHAAEISGVAGAQGGVTELRVYSPPVR